MRSLRVLLAAACLPLVLLAGCGAGDTYNPALGGGGGGVVPAFTVTVYNGDPESVGNGSEAEVNTFNTPLVIIPGTSGAGSRATVIVRSTDGFTGTATVTLGQPSSGTFQVLAPSPSTIEIPANGSAVTSFEVRSDDYESPAFRGTALLTVTSGNITRTYTVQLIMTQPV